MLNFSILQIESILLLMPRAPLSTEDFASLTADVDGYLSDHTRLHGVMIHTKGFPGWENFGGFTAHMHFVREHHKQIERIAVVTNTPLAGMAEIRHFPFADDAKALEWLQAV